MIWSHAGKYGDLIWSLPAMLGVMERHGVTQCHIQLKNKYQFFQWDDKAIRPLIDCQPYHGYFEDLDYPVDGNVWWIDSYREGNVKEGWNIPRFVLDHFNLPYSWMEKSWLHVTPNKKAKYVFSRNTQPHCRNDAMPWKQIVQDLGQEAVFLGHGNEYQQFRAEFGDVPYIPTDNLLQASEIIAGCEKVFCNQSALHTIGEALKKPIMLEVCAAWPSVLIQRDGVENMK